MGSRSLGITEITRLALFAGGVETDEAQGVRDLELTAAHGVFYANSVIATAEVTQARIDRELHRARATEKTPNRALSYAAKTSSPDTARWDINGMIFPRCWSGGHFSVGVKRARVENSITCAIDIL